MSTIRQLIAAFLLILPIAVETSAQGPRILWIGNSYSVGQPQSLADFSSGLGLAAPSSHQNIIGGATIASRAATPSAMAGILAGVTGPIDVVVLQGQSLEATTTFSNPTAFVNDIETVFQAVRNHSPGARAVLYQTWARGPGHGVYTGGFVADPATLHAQIRTTYTAARDNLNAIFGAGSAALAPVGDAFAAAAWDPVLYAGDLSHPSAVGHVLAASVLMEAIQEIAAREIPIDFASGTDPLALTLGAAGVSESVWYALLDQVDAVDPLFPGSADDLALSVEINAVTAAVPTRFARANDVVTVHSTSPTGLYAGLPFVLLVQPFTGAPPATTHGFPELVFELTPVLLSFGPVALATPVLSISETVTPGLSGSSVYLQGLSLAPSAVQTNPFFTASNAVEVRFL